MRPATIDDLSAHFGAKPMFLNLRDADMAMMQSPRYALGEELARCASCLLAGMRAAPSDRWWMLRDVVGAHAIPYVFERNPGRWPHGLLVPVNRSYEPLQPGGPAGLTAAEALALGLGAWQRSDAIGVQFDDDVAPLYDDSFWWGQKAATWLPALVILIDRIAARLKERPTT